MVALQAMVFDHPELAQRAQLRASSISLSLAHNEDPGSNTGHQLLGKGVRCKRSNRKQLLDSVSRYVSSGAAPGWTPQDVVTAFSQRAKGTGVYLYQRCDLGFEQVSTSSHRKTSSRQNYYVLLEHNATAERVGRVVRLLWVRHPDNNSWQGQQADPSPEQQVELDRDLRLALVDVYKPQGQGELIRVADKSNFSPSVVYGVSDVKGKLVKGEPAEGSELFFATYSNMSKAR
jgi:hypothetical protein